MPTILRLLRSSRPPAYPSPSPLSSITKTTTPIRTLTNSIPRSAGPKQSSGDYGSGTGDPVGETPQKQGTSQTSRSQEHPGPESPVSSGGGGGSSGGSGSKDAQQGGSSGAGAQQGGNGGGGQGKRSKIADHDISMEADRVESDDVKQHNKEMSQRFDRASEQSGAVEDKVDKGFWSGQGGRDRDP